MGILDVPAVTKRQLGYALGSALQTKGTLADVAAIPNCKWLFSPETGFYSDQAGTTRQTADGGAVKCWKDGSPNADHATTASSGLTLSRGIAGGTDALNIAGSSTRLKTTGTFDSSFNAGMTTFIVASNPTLSTNQVIASSQDARWYTAWNGSNQNVGPVFNATSYTQPFIPADVYTNANTSAVYPGLMIECFRYNGPSVPMDFLYHGYPSQPAQAASATALAITGVLNLGGLSGSFAWGGKIVAAVVFNRALTDTEVQVVYNYLAGVAQTMPKPRLQCIGNSLTTGSGSSTAGTYVPNTPLAGYTKNGNKDYPSQLLDMFPANEIIIRQDALPGRTNQMIASDLSRTSMSMYDPASHAKRIALVWEITNDLATNITTNIAAVDAGTVPPAYTNFVTICQTLQAQGWLVGAMTCTPRSDLVTTTNNPLFYRAYQVINRLIRTNYASFANFLVDVAADPRLGYPGSELNTTYFNADKVHMTDEGYRVVASIVKRAIDPWLGLSATARTLLSKSVAGSANVTLNTLEAGTVLLPGGNGIVTLTGALTANINVVLPLIEGAQALFFNNTSGAFTLTLKAASGTGYAITQGKKARAFCDGTNWVQATSEV